MRPEDRSRNSLIGVAVIIIIILIAIFVIRRRSTSQIVNNPVIPTPVSVFQQNLQTTYGITVPSTAIKSDLHDVSGGNQMGLATLDKVNNQNLYTLIANLENPTPGYFYEAWVINGNDFVPLGRLTVAKAGWLLNYNSPKNLEDHKTIWITLERANDNTPEKHILEGSF